MEKYYSISPYAYCAGNPILFIDPNGLSVHINRLGYVVQQDDSDGDNGVYYHDDLTGWDNKSTLEKTGKGINPVGDLGGNIDMSDFFMNKLNDSKKLALSMDIMDFKKAVEQDGDFDLKYNINTIWGVAWQYDENMKKKGKNITTLFTFGKNTTGITSADFGNFHYGFVGDYTYYGIGMNIEFLSFSAGLAEIKKCWDEGSKFEAIQRLYNSTTAPYYGDREIDNKHIRNGYNFAEKLKRTK